MKVDRQLERGEGSALGRVGCNHRQGGRWRRQQTSALPFVETSNKQICERKAKREVEEEAEEETTKTVKEINEATAETLFDSFSVFRFQLNEMENFNCCVCVVIHVSVCVCALWRLHWNT